MVKIKDVIFCHSAAFYYMFQSCTSGYILLGPLHKDALKKNPHKTIA